MIDDDSPVKSEIIVFNHIFVFLSSFPVLPLSLSCPTPCLDALLDAQSSNLQRECGNTSIPRSHDDLTLPLSYLCLVPLTTGVWVVD